MRRILITSALPYANGSIHLGHLVEYIQTDIWSRFQKMNGHEVFYVCADDTHGTPIMIKAQNEGITPKQLIADVHKEHAKDFADFYVNFDNFYTTDSEENKLFSEEIFKSLEKNKKISTKEIEQYFDDDKQMFLPDRFIKGECPKCNAKDQYGDSCEACGATYSPTDLIKPYSSLSGSTPVKKKTKHYFFNLSECEQFLKDWTASGTLQPEAENKIQEWFKSGLQDWDITRDKPYFGFLIPGETDKYFYVWLDAPIGYMASFKNLIDQKGKINFDDFWSSDSSTELYHFIGKDILYFHALFWPATLHFSGYRKPTKIFAHGFLTVNGEKMSKSRGTFITARSFLDNIHEPEFLRYYFASKLNDSMSDIDLNLDDLMSKVNSDLVGKLVNIPSRTFGFIHKLFNGNIRLIGQLPSGSKYSQLVSKSIELKNEIVVLYESRLYSQLVRKVFTLVEEINELISDEQPWSLAKDYQQNSEQLHNILTTSAIVFRNSIIYLSPILPNLSQEVASLFNETDFNSFEQVKDNIKKINKYNHLYQRLDKDNLVKLIENNKKMDNTNSIKKEHDKENHISIDDFNKIDLRVAEVIQASHVDGADKLLHVTLNVGKLGKKNVFAGIKSKYNPESLIGKKVSFVANLAPRKMKFGVSEGMILAASDSNEGPFILLADDGAQAGMKIK
ncbi:MAG: methionine--tRNA ligase [Betaproteobacteria bacterium]|nr:methionine--tRNA ligase [Betaproteobacteria bacterium]